MTEIMFTIEVLGTKRWFGLVTVLVVLVVFLVIRRAVLHSRNKARRIENRNDAHMANRLSGIKKTSMMFVVVLVVTASYFIAGRVLLSIEIREHIAGLRELASVLGNESSIWSAHEWELEKIGQPAVRPLVRVLEDSGSDSGLRREVVWILYKIGGPKAFEAIVESLHDNNSSVQMTAILCLGQTGDARAIAPLKKALESNNASVRAQATRALGEIDIDWQRR